MPEPEPTAPETTAAWEGDRSRGAVDLGAAGPLGSLADLEITARDLRAAQGRLESLLRLRREGPARPVRA